MSESKEMVTALDGKRLKAVEMIAAGTAKAKVAKAIGVDRTTIRNWMNEEHFAHAVEEQKARLRQLILDPAPWISGMLEWKAELPAIMSALAQTAKDPSNPRQTKAAEIILHHCKVDDLDPEPSQDERLIREFLQKLTAQPQEAD